jgi:hypothetical protein
MGKWFRTAKEDTRNPDDACSSFIRLGPSKHACNLRASAFASAASPSPRCLSRILAQVVWADVLLQGFPVVAGVAARRGEQLCDILSL